MHRILVIDDDVDILHVVGIILKKDGYKVFTESTGDHFFEDVAKCHPHLIILDIQLGKTDGRFLCKQLKNMEEHKGIKVLLFSANPLYAKHIDEYCCDYFMEKPFEVKTMLKAVHKLLPA